VCEIGPEGSTLKPQRAKHNRGEGRNTMPKSIVLECPASDRSYFQQLVDEGHDLTIVEVERFEGTLQIIEVIIQLTAALSPILIAYLSLPSEEKQAKKLIIEGQRKTFENYSPEEIAAILESE
jgi:hypothetical protein